MEPEKELQHMDLHGVETIRYRMTQVSTTKEVRYEWKTSLSSAVHVTCGIGSYSFSLSDRKVHHSYNTYTWVAITTRFICPSRSVKTACSCAKSLTNTWNNLQPSKIVVCPENAFQSLCWVEYETTRRDVGQKNKINKDEADLLFYSDSNATWLPSKTRDEGSEEAELQWLVRAMECYSCSGYSQWSGKRRERIWNVMKDREIVAPHACIFLMAYNTRTGME